ncbi:hypothetical protein V6N13_110899 [Hibiscus sabdariffa]
MCKTSMVQSQDFVWLLFLLWLLLQLHLLAVVEDSAGGEDRDILTNLLEVAGMRKEA